MACGIRALISHSWHDAFLVTVALPLELDESQGEFQREG